MGRSIYVCSTKNFSGKTAICAGIGRRLRLDGFSFAYMKPVSIKAQRREESKVDEDVDALKRLFDMEHPEETLAPIRLTSEDVEALLPGGVQTTPYLDQVRQAVQQIVPTAEIVLMEGGATLAEGSALALSPRQMAQALNSRVLLIVRYESGLQVVDDVLLAQSIFAEYLLGAILNAVPEHAIPFARDTLAPTIRHRGIPVYGILPQERLLQALSVGEIARLLNGDILSAAENCEALVENLMIGAMNVEAALAYFRSMPNKAVITGGDRLDIQLAALETSTRCLVLTGNLHPSSVILNRANEVGVPVILVKHDTLSAVAVIKRFFGRTRFRPETKIETMERILSHNIDFKRLYADLGLVGGRAP